MSDRRTGPSLPLVEVSQSQPESARVGQSQVSRWLHLRGGRQSERGPSICTSRRAAVS